MAKSTKKKKGAPTGDANVFIAWGGEKSGLVADGLAQWIPKLIDSARPWMSKESIRSGTAWFPTIMGQLAKTEFGIVCLTLDNVDNRWIHFEAGAIAKRVSEDARVVPYLIGMASRHVRSPFNALQHAEAKKDPTFKLVVDINDATGATVEQKVLRERFEMFWPELAEVIAKAEAVAGETAKLPDTAKMVEEVLGIVRSTGGDIAKVLELVRTFSAFLNRPFPYRPMEAMFGSLASTSVDVGSVGPLGSIGSLYGALAQQAPRELTPAQKAEIQKDVQEFMNRKKGKKP